MIVSELTEGMTTNQDTPEEFVPKLVAFIRQNENWLHSTINAVGWTIEDLEASAEVPKPKPICCPLNPEHRMPEQFLEAHVMKCEKNNAFYPDISNLDLNSSLQGNCSLGELELGHVIPEFNKDSTSLEKSSSAQTLAELLKAERDAKRRRAAHRGKRVHSNKKSYNEVMREIIANQMLTINDCVENDEGCYAHSKSDMQEPIVSNPCYLAVGESFHRGNPYKRWLSIEREEEETIAKLQKQPAKSEENRKQRYSRHDEDRRSSRRDHRDEHDRYYPSFKHDRDYRRDECRYLESRKENRCKDEDRRHSRYDDSRRDRREYKKETRDSKRDESTVAEHSRKRSRDSREKESRNNGHWEKEDEVAVKPDRCGEKLKRSGDREKKHKKKKMKKHKHKKKHRGSSSSS